MEIKATYRELNSYMQARFGKPVSLSFAGEKEMRVTYTQRVLIKDINVSVNIHIDEVRADTILITYDGAFGLDMIISGVLSFFKSQFPELSAGIHPEEGHRIRINLSEIEKAKAAVENIELRDIRPREEYICIEFGLKVPK
ncbi:MAG: hypothetical protein K2K98_08605 [Muribaculaceae bacterium]|nr:hypothetical protein [Muribaculaceae bacterium]